MGRSLLILAALLLCQSLGCAPKDSDQTVTLTLSASSVGREGELLRRQLSRFERSHPGLQVRLEATPDAADQRHQLYVQWLNANSNQPDVLQLDVIWTAELAAAGWLRPLPKPAAGEFFEAALSAHRHAGKLYALPWFVDVGMLYYRSDLIERAPESFSELRRLAKEHQQAGHVQYGLVWQNARYEGLVTTFLEVLGGFGGSWLEPNGALTIDTPKAREALGFMKNALADGLVPGAALGWQEEETRFAFQNGRALFMRNWPYAYPLLESEDSIVRGKFTVAKMPANPGGHGTATLGGGGLAISRHSRYPEQSERLVHFLTAPAQLRERARVLGHLPPRPDLFADTSLSTAFGAPPPTMRDIIDGAQARPPHPAYSELSGELQIQLHRALSGQTSVREALRRADSDMRRTLAQSSPRPGASAPIRTEALFDRAFAWALSATALAALVLWLVLLGRAGRGRSKRGRGALWLLLPTFALLALVALVPLLSSSIQALYICDLRMPWKNDPAATLDNFRAIFDSERFWDALAHTLFFVAVSVTLELCLGLALALSLVRLGQRAIWVRPLALLPWAIPTVIAGLIFRFMVDGASSPANQLLLASGLASSPQAWLSEPTSAWLTTIVADVWKTTPFVGLLLLAALAGIDRQVYQAAELDGANPIHQFWYITLPAIAPTLWVVLLFRCLDALKVFDLVYALTQGGPGTATEPLALFTFTTFFGHLNFGQGAALGLVSVAVAAVVLVVLARRARFLGEP